MKPWQTAAWRKRRAEFIKDKSCQICGSTEHLAIHHPQKRNTLPDEVYESFEGCMILCRKCHFKIHRGYHICYKCKKNLTKYPTCFDCLPKENKQRIEKFKKEMAEIAEEDNRAMELIDRCHSEDPEIREKALEQLQKENDEANKEQLFFTLPCGEIAKMHEEDRGLVFFGCHDYCPKSIEMTICEFFLKEYKKMDEELMEG